MVSVPVRSTKGLKIEQRCTLPCYKGNPLACQRVTVLSMSVFIYIHSVHGRLCVCFVDCLLRRVTSSQPQSLQIRPIKESSANCGAP